MLLDTSIALGVRAPQFEDYSQLAAQTQANALRAQVAQQEMEQNALRMRYAEEDRARAEAARRQSAAAAAASRKLLSDAFKAPDPAKYLIDAGRPDLLDEVTKYTESVTKLGEAKSKAQTAEEDAQLGLISRGLTMARTPEERMPLYSSLYNHPKYGSVWRQMYPDINSFAAAGEDLRAKDPQTFGTIVSMTGAHYGELEKNLAKPPEYDIRETPQGLVRVPKSGTGEAQPITMGGQPIAPKASESDVKAAQAAEATASAVDTLSMTLKNVDDLLKHPGFETSVGATFQPGFKYIPGTSASDFNRRLEQVKGGAFLQAFNTLRGGGQITEVEGKKATDAITRMDTSQSEEEFKAAAEEFKGLVKNMLERAKKRGGAAVTPSAPTTTPSGASVSNW